MKKHRIESLNFRDSLMIGDIVCNNGKAYEWDASDYCRSQKGMENIKHIYLSDDILEANGFVRYNDKMEGLPWNCTHWSLLCDGRKIYYMTSQSVDVLENNFGVYEKVLHVERIITVDQLQRALRCCGLFELANNFIIS